MCVYEGVYNLIKGDKKNLISDSEDTKSQLPTRATKPIEEKKRRKKPFTNLIRLILEKGYTLKPFHISENKKKKKSKQKKFVLFEFNTQKGKKIISIFFKKKQKKNDLQKKENKSCPPDINFFFHRYKSIFVF